MARFCDLSEELIVEILFRLPADCLVQLKCVCKVWYAIIKDPAFVTKNFRYTSSISTSIVIKYFYSDTKTYELCNTKKMLTVSNDGFPYFEIEENISIPKLCERHEYSTDGLGSQCNGLICIHDDQEHTILLCNPVTKQSKVLSTSCIVQDGFQTTEIVGFGYDSKTDDYKVIRVVSFRVDEYNIHPGPSRAELYSLHADSWREIKNMDIETGRCTDSEKQAYSNGVCYWMVQVEDKQMLISFDLCNEEFDKIPMPDERQGVDLRKNISAWNGSVAVMMFPMWSPGIDHPGIPFIDMWVMKKGSYSWIKHQTIKLDGGDITGPLAFWKSDELLMDTKNLEVVSYNLHTRKFVNLPIENVMVCRAMAFFKTLVSLY